jgi:hypothetical protein
MNNQSDTAIAIFGVVALVMATLVAVAIFAFTRLIF